MPSFFDGMNYNYWKAWMRIFIQSIDCEFWRMVINGPLIPIKIVEDKILVKFEDDWDDKDLKMVHLNT